MCAKEYSLVGGAEPAGAGICMFFLIFGIVVSPSTILTMQYSIKAINTKIVQTDINASTAFKYDTGGNDACDFACCVDNVSNDVTPNVTLAGAASGLIQNETHFQRNQTLHECILYFDCVLYTYVST